MRTIKSTKTLELEREPITLDESLPELQRIADEEGLSLSRDWSEVVRIYQMDKL